jgi:tol-pal system protein YbgF
MFATFIKTSVLATLLIGCATARPPAEAELTRTVTALRAQNTAYARKIEELENQVFVLSAELDMRRSVETPRPSEPSAAAVPAPPLPETKLLPGRETPPPEAGEPPGSLVDEAVVEYAGAAAEERSGKRPMLKLWGQGAAESEGSVEDLMPERPRAPAGASPGPRAPQDAAESTTRSRNKDSEVALYQSANEHLRAGDTNQAVDAFRTFVKRYPTHELADNAQYWLGECFYHSKNYSKALREFRRVVEQFPRGNKVPDALLKLGFSYLALGSTRPGREALSELARTYPRHPASGLAAAKLMELAEQEKKEAR